MRHRADHEFWKCYDRLPDEIRQLADRTFQVLKENPRHPSLRFKKIGRRWVARVGLNYRALALEIDGDYFWYWIGPHDEYERLIK